MPPMALRPRTIPTPMMWPIAPKARVSARVNPAGSPVWRPDGLSTSCNPDRAFLFADGARPNLPANRKRVVDPTTICASNNQPKLLNRWTFLTSPALATSAVSLIATEYSTTKQSKHIQTKVHKFLDVSLFPNFLNGWYGEARYIEKFTVKSQLTRFVDDPM